jgi:hypothetical protein
MQSLVDDVIARIKYENPTNGQLKIILTQFEKSVAIRNYEEASDRAVFIFHKIQKQCRENRLKRKNIFIDKCIKNGILNLPKLFMTMIEKNPKSREILEEFKDVFDIEDFLDTKTR